MDWLRKIIRRKREREQEPECPSRCAGCNRALQAEKVDGTELERCPECGGTWMSGELLEQVLDQAEQQNPEIEPTLSSDGEADIGNTYAPSRQPRDCPSCREAMENYQFQGSGIWIDACPEGHGVWLDRGELRLLASRRRDQGLHSPALQSMAEVLLETL